MSVMRVGGALAIALSIGTLGAARTPASPSAPAYDVVLAGGTVVDGTGGTPMVADVAIAGDSIVAIGAALDTRGAGTVLDVRGRIVAPGFWDNHAHLVTLESHPMAENFIRQGITTILAPQHSQDQPFPLDAYMARVRMAPNVGLFTGHTWIRKRVMGLANRRPTAAELAWMTALVDSSMVQGALGLATGLEYTPATYAGQDEIVALAKVAAKHGGIYVTHMRDEGAGVMQSVRQTLDVGRRAGIPVQINHLKVTGAAQWGWSARILSLLDSATAAGRDVAFDVYPYDAYSTYSDLMFPAWALADGPAAFARRVADPRTRARLVREMRVLFTQQTGPGPETIRFREMAAHPELAGRTLADYLDRKGQPRTVAAAVEALIALQLEGGFIGVFTGMDEQDIERFVRHPRAMFETDGDLVELGKGYPHPRSYGSFPRVLSRYVRERKTLTLVDAVRRMTRMPAEWLAQADRGTLVVGRKADVVVFDPNSIADRAQYTDPHHFAEGVVHVLVNGQFVLRDGTMTGAKPGRFLERRRAARAVPARAVPARRSSSGAPRKALFILLDGIPADVLERVPTPFLDAIAAEGAYARARVGGELGGRTETPTISAPGYMSLLTGTWANKHNVWNNSNQKPNYDYWNLFRIVETADPSRTTAIFSTWLDNRTVLIGEGKPGAGTFRLDHAADGFELDTARFPHDKSSRYILDIDRHVADAAASYVAARGPDLSWVYLQHTDDVAHAFGDSPQSDHAVQQADSLVGRIWSAVRQRQALGEEWMVVVTTDHGRDSVSGRGHGGRSTRERTTWIVTNQRTVTPRFAAGSAAIVDIAPAILQHLRITAPPAVAREMEGTSFLRGPAR